MRINKFIALTSGMSRRAADRAVQNGRVSVNGKLGLLTDTIQPDDIVVMDNQRLVAPEVLHTVMLNKPVGYVVSRNGQGSRNIYELLPPEYHKLKPIGRLDKDSSGLLVLTNDGDLAQTLTHPSFQKVKQYEISLSKPLQPLHRQMISDFGIILEDGRSQLGLDRLVDGDDTQWQVTMHEGRNRQIRRTFESLGYAVTRLHRTQFGTYSLPATLKPGHIQPM
jgi:23S rRNA pseudouridine2605 synthase